MISKYYDKILLGIALAVLLGVFGYAALRPDPQPITELVDIPALRPENTFEVSEVPELELTIPQWEEPPPQSAGSDWIFDVFTPPVIHFNTRTEQFIIEGEPEERREPWPIELVAVRQDDYRIQMLGWVGRAGDYIINLENLETGELVLAREGRDYEDLDITVRSFKVERLNTNPDGTPVYQDVATAVIHDKRLDREVTLRSDRRRKDEELTAVFRSRTEADREFRARAGDSFTLGDYTYRVEELEAPVRATVTRTGGETGSERETKTMIARETGEPPPAGNRSSPQNPQGTGENGAPAFDSSESQEGAADLDF